MPNISEFIKFIYPCAYEKNDTRYYVFSRGHDNESFGKGKIYLSLPTGNGKRGKISVAGECAGNLEVKSFYSEGRDEMLDFFSWSETFRSLNVVKRTKTSAME